MRKKKANQKGFTLVEIIVSLLILSIVVVSVLTAFTQSARTNVRTKSIQGAEDLCANLIEFVEAGGTDFEGELGYTVGSKSTTGKVDTYVLSNVPMGYRRYDVRVTQDNEPTDYSAGLNDYESIWLGDKNSASIMVDISNRNCQLLDEGALEAFYTMHCDKIDEVNAAKLDADPEATDLLSKPSSASSLKFDVSREVLLVTKQTGTKMTIKAVLRYELKAEVVIPDGFSRTLEYTVFTSDPFDCPDVADGFTLGSIYLAYEDSSVVSGISPVHIRILNEDGAAMANSAFGADLYIALQDHIAEASDAAGKTLSERMSGKSAVKVSFVEKGSTNVQEPYVLKNAEGQIVAKRKVYCSGGLTLTESVSLADHVEAVPNRLIATEKGIRAVTYRFEVIDPELSVVAATGKTVVLRKTEK